MFQSRYINVVSQTHWAEFSTKDAMKIYRISAFFNVLNLDVTIPEVVSSCCCFTIINNPGVNITVHLYCKYI